MSANVARTVLRIVSGLPQLSVAPDQPEPLTYQELNVVRSLADGCSYLQAAAALGVSVNTLRSHVRNIYRKLCVGTRTEAVMTALQLGLLERR
jgi:DNA-binding NarL/FixJ family response regulator